MLPHFFYTAALSALISLALNCRWNSLKNQFLRLQKNEIKLNLNIHAQFHNFNRTRSLKLHSRLKCPRELKQFFLLSACKKLYCIILHSSLNEFLPRIYSIKMCFFYDYITVLHYFYLYSYAINYGHRFDIRQLRNRVCSL